MIFVGNMRAWPTFLKGSIALTTRFVPLRFARMARRLRVEFSGAIYRVMNSGDRRDIFRDDQDWHEYLETSGEACPKTNWQMHTFCLLRNHFHRVEKDFNLIHCDREDFDYWPPAPGSQMVAAM